MSTRTFFSCTPLSAALRMVFLAATLSAPLAHADEYSDVNRLVRAGQYPEALSKAEQYLASKPRDPQMRFLRGVIQTETGKADDAIITFTKISEDYPELPEPYNNLAVLYAGQSQFDKARSALEMAIRTNPSYTTAHENLGDIYARLASQAYSKALQLDSANTAVQPKLALIRTLFSADSKSPKKPAATAAAPATVAAIKPVAPPPVTPVAPVAKAVPAAAPVRAVETPVVAAKPSPAPPVAIAKAKNDIETAVRAWADAWASQNMEVYLSSYAPAFNPPGKQSRNAWEDERRVRIVGKARIQVKLSNLVVSTKGKKATAKFKQDYTSDSFSDSTRKTLDMVNVGGRWVIMRESTGS